MGRQQRRKVVVPMDQLGFQMARYSALSTSGHPTDTPSTSDTLWCEEVMHSRQSRMDVRPVVVNIELRKAATPLTSMLKPAKLTVHRAETLSASETLMSRVVGDAQFSSLDRPCRIADSPSFENLVEELKAAVLRQNTEEWMNHAVPFPLSPAALQKLIRKPELVASTKHKMAVATFNAHMTSVLFIGAQPDDAKKVFDTLFPSALEQHDGGLDFSPVCGDYVMKLRSGNAPQFSTDPEESTFAIVVENDDAHIHNRLAYYEAKTGCPIRSLKNFSYPERKWLERRSETDLYGKNLVCLEFEKEQDRKKATQSLDVLNMLYNDTMLSSQEVVEETFLRIVYDQYLTKDQHLKVTLVHEAETSFFAKVLECNSCQVTYERENGQSLANNREMILTKHPDHLITFEEKDWFIRRVAEANKIELESTESCLYFGGEKLTTGRRKTENPRRSIDHELFLTAFHSNIYRPMGDSKLFTRDISRRSDCPWRVRKISKEDEIDEFLVMFRSAAVGRAIVKDSMESYWKEPIYRCDNHDLVGPTLHPIVRFSTTISRRMRFAFDNAISKFDRDIRRTFIDFMNKENAVMAATGASMFKVRVYEKFQPGSATGRIGVEGWNRDAVKYFFEQLQTLLRPVKLHAESAPDLLFGIGEVFIRSLENQSRGKLLVDVDKYRQAIYLFGDEAENARILLSNYPARKSRYTVRTQILALFPYFNDLGRKVVTPKTILRLAEALGAQCSLSREDKTIQFDGTIKAYEKLTQALAEISSAVFTRQVPSDLRQDMYLHCPICWTETENQDFYRLGCGHSMCRSCLNKWVSAEMEDCRFDIKCNVRGCNKPFRPKEIKAFILGDSRRMRELDGQKLETFASRVREAMVLADPLLRVCATPNCVGVFVVTPNAAKGASKQCKICEAPYCTKCGDFVHPDQTCETAAKVKSHDGSIEVYINKLGAQFIKNCPRCNILVAKNEGCDHMECKCGAHWCWVCRFLGETGKDVYGHMSEEHGTYGGDQFVFQPDGGAVGPDGEQIDLEEQFAIAGEPFGMARPEPVPVPVPVERPRRRGPAVIIPAPPPTRPPVVRPTPPPRRIPLVREFPRILLDLYPIYYDNELYQDALVRLLNSSETQEEFDERLAEMFRKPLERDRKNRERLEELNRRAD